MYIRPYPIIPFAILCYSENKELYGFDKIIMYRLQEYKERVIQYYCCEDDFLILQEKENDLVQINSNEINRSFDKSAYFTFYKWNNSLLFSSAEKEIIEVFNKGNKTTEIKGDIYGINNKTIISSIQMDDEKFIIYNSKLKEKAVIENIIGGYHRFIDDDYFVFSEFLKGRTLNFLSLKTYKLNTISFAEETWFSTDEDDTNEYEGKIFQIVGKWNNLLLVHIGRYRLIAIDINTQKEVWRIENFLGEFSSNKFIQFTSRSKAMCNILLDTKKDKAYVFAREHLFEIDLHTKTTKKIKDYKTPDFHWNIRYVKLYDDVISFSASEYMKFPSHFGVIDRETKEIVWSTKCKGGRYLTTAPQLHNNKLYISDSENTLYIYEKGDNVN